MSHAEEFVKAFICRNRRPRYLADGCIPLKKIYHDLERELEPSRCLEIPGRLQNGKSILQLVSELTSTMVACVLASDNPQLPLGQIPMSDLADHPDWYSEEVIVSFEPGQLAYYAAEGSTPTGRYLLVKDDQRMRKATALMDKLCSESRSGVSKRKHHQR